MATITPQRISIALCTYNGAAFLAAQLDSFRAQSRLPDELVVCDDGSLDDTLHMLERFAAEADFPVLIIKNPVRLGSTANFSQAIGLCTGKIIVLSDQDDIWQTTKLARIESAFTATPNAGGFFSNGILINEHGQKLRGSLWGRVGFNKHQQAAVRKNQAFDVLFRGNFATGATMAFRKDITSVLLPIPAGWVHDYWIASLLAATSRLDFIDAPLIEYRCHISQQLGIQNGMRESWHRFLASNNTTYQFAAARWSEIRDRLRQHGNHRNSISLSKCEVLIRHLQRRGTLPPQRLRRLPSVFAEILNGNYFQYSSGLTSILRDILSH